MQFLPPTRVRRPARHSEGFTLSELLVALAVASIIVVLVYQVFVSQQRVYTAQEDVGEAQQNARVAVDELTRTVSPLGAGAAVDQGQVRILMAHPNQLLFNADLSGDHDALAAGTDLTPVAGYSTDDPYAAVPGSYASGTAETYRYYLRPDAGGVHHSLFRETNLEVNGRREVAMHLGNQRVGQALFSYWGDFDGNGTFETLDRVDRTTSTRVAAGAPLDAVIRRIDLNVIAETPFPDPRLATNSGYRQTVLKTSITPRNVWDCPTIQPVPTGLGVLRAPLLRNTVTNLQFRVTRGALAEQGRTVVFQLTGPGGHDVQVFDISGTTDQDTTGPDGFVTAVVDWPNPGPPCTTLPAGTYTVTGTTSTPPTLDTPFGTCPSDTASIELTVLGGLIATARFDQDPLQLASCGDDLDVGYELLDGCGQQVHPDDVTADQVWFVDPDLAGTLTPDTVPDGQPTGVVNYQTDTAAYSPGASRDPTPPHAFTTTVEARLGGVAGPSIGSTAVEVYPLPDTLSGLTGNLSGAAGAVLFSDCPSSVGNDTETFQIADACGNPVWTLDGSYLGNTYSVEARLDAAYPGSVGGLTSTNNAVVPITPVTIRENTGTDGEFEVSYTPPTCGLGDLSRAVELVVTPSWDPGNFQTVPFEVQPCTSCSVQVLDASGTPTTLLNRECEPEYDVVVTHCEDPDAEVELVLVPILGNTPSFDPNTYQNRITLSFDRTNPAGEAQQAHARLFMGWADATSRFQIMAYMPDQATYAGGLIPSAVMCQSDPVDVDTSCEEILISDSPDNRGGFPTNSNPEDVPICALEGSEVHFRVKDCDQNWRDYAADDLLNLAGTSHGILVEAVDRETRALLDSEEVDTLFEVDQNGVGRVNQPYFQGSLLVTQDPDDLVGSGLLRVPEGRVVELRATYRDPNDSSDNGCEAFALLVPPLPVCLPFPVASFDDWQGDLTVLGGDAVVAGDLDLPLAPQLVIKEEFDPLDRFFNAYVGGQILQSGSPVGSTGPAGQPLALHPNYFQRVPDTASLLTRLDYGMLKALARARRVYWEPDPVSGLLVNPLRTDPGTGLLLTGTFQQVVQLPGPGTVTANHPSGFLFIDAPTSLQSASALDSADLSDLPRYGVVGDFYTEGLIYVAGSVDLGPLGGGEPVAVEFADARDASYNESDGGFTRIDLPFDFDSASGPVPAGTVPVHWNGVLYTEGEVSLVGDPVVHGVLSAERGVRSSGAAQVWYDPQWLETRLDLCSECCGLGLSPSSPAVLLGDTLQLAANRPQGQVLWESLDPQVAVVDTTGLVEPLQEGSAVIRATDAAGCIAEVEVTVTCGLTLASSEGTALVPGDVTNISASGARGSLTWVSDNPAALELDVSFGVSVLGTAMGIGGSQVTATDTVTTSAGPAQCVATLDFVVNCPGDHTLAADTLTPAIGQAAALAVSDGAGNPVSDAYTFFADGVALNDPSYTPTDLTTVQITANLPGDSCTLGPLTLSPSCPDLVLSASPPSAAVTDLVTLSVREVGAELPSTGFTFAATPASLATVAGALLTPLGPGTATVTASDSLGCEPPPLALTLTCPAGRAIKTDPAQPEPGDTVSLAVSGGNVLDYTFTADGVTLGAPTYTFVGQAAVVFGATLDGGVCPLSQTVTPTCGSTSVIPATTVATVGDTVGLIVQNASGADVTASHTFTVVSGPGTVVGSAVRLDAVGTVQVSASNGAGCAATSATILAQPPP